MITVVGSANMDLITRVERLPDPGETVLATSLLVAPGGKGANQAVAAARAGSSVDFVGRVGADQYGRNLVGNLQRNHVSIDHLLTTEATPTGMAMIEVDDSGENTIVVVAGANGQVSPADVDRARRAISSSAVVVVQLEIPMRAVVQAVRLAHESGATVVLNAAPARALDASLLRLVDVLVANTDETRALSGLGSPVEPAAAAGMLLDTGVKAVIVTLGPQGAIVVTSDEETDIPVFRTRVADTTGAGDTFVGNLAHALEEKRSLSAAARFAAAAAALSIEKEGAQSSMPTLAETEQLLESQK